MDWYWAVFLHLSMLYNISSRKRSIKVQFTVKLHRSSDSCWNYCVSLINDVHSRITHSIMLLREREARDSRLRGTNMPCACIVRETYKQWRIFTHSVYHSFVQLNGANLNRRWYYTFHNEVSVSFYVNTCVYGVYVIESDSFLWRYMKRQFIGRKEITIVLYEFFLHICSKNPNKINTQGN